MSRQKIWPLLSEPDYKRVEAERNALAAEMREDYPAAVTRLADLFRRMAECDRECSRINGAAPDGEHRRLLKVELTARGVKGLLQPDVFIAEMLRLPYFTRDSGPIYAWPPPAPPLSRRALWCRPVLIGMRSSRHGTLRSARRACASSPISMSAPGSARSAS